jgi:aminoglycoside 6-adenylyltransferase
MSNLEQRFADWAWRQAAIQAVIIVGSQARSNHPADEWSDLDLVVFASDAVSYLRDSIWLNTFGVVIAAVDNPFGQHDREWIALYDDGAKLDVAFLSIDPAATPTLQAMLDAFPYPDVLQRGVRVLVDKTGASTELNLPAPHAPLLPDQTEFTALINRMWFDAIKTAMFIRRHDLWRAKQLCDGAMKHHLLTMLEWQAAVQPDARDIWYDGRFIAEWADREALDDLPETFAAYNAQDMRRALLATLELFRRLAQHVSTRLGYTYSVETDRLVTTHLQSILRENA